MSKVTSIKTLEKKIASAIPTQIGGEIAVLLDADAGEFDKLYTITSLTDFERVFGVEPVSKAIFYGNNSKKKYYDWCRYLISRGNVLRVVRADLDIVDGSDVKANAEVTVHSLTVKLEAVGYGTYYNKIKAKFSPVGAGTTHFAMSVVYAPDANTEVILEQYNILSLDSNDTYFIGKIESNVIKVTVSGTFTDGDVLTGTKALEGAVLTKPDASYPNVDVADPSWYSGAYDALDSLSDREYRFETLLTFCTAGLAVDDVKPKVEKLLSDRDNDFLFLQVEQIFSTENDNVAMYEPRVKVSKLDYFIPASIAVADTISRLYRDNLVYKAPAGIPYGVLTDVVDVETILSKTEIADIQAANKNPIVVKQGTGIVIWGNSTYTSNPLAIGRVSVRLLVDYFKQTVYQRSQRFMFMDNIPLTWNEWKNEVEPIVRDIANVGALIKYRVVCDASIMTEEDIANGIMRGAIYIQPPYQINEIEITFTIDESGVSFE